MKTTLAATKNWILKPFAIVLAFVFNALFGLISGWTPSQTLAITIIIFTFVVRALLTPLTLKQQRSSRRMTRLQPKVEKIQEKYKNKKDPESAQRMNAEVQELYRQNKANPMSGCLPMLIQMPILFALYEVFRNVPFYVTKMGDLYTSMATCIQGISGFGEQVKEMFPSVINGIKNFDPAEVDSMIDLLYHLSRSQWQELIEAFTLSGNTSFMEWYQAASQYSSLGWGAFTFNLSEAPGWRSLGIIFPIISGGTTFLMSWLSQRATEKRQKMVNPDGKLPDSQQSMKMMTYMFPIMTLFFTASMPLALGLYWIASNIFGIVSQLICDSIIDREEYEEALRHRDELIEKRKEREKQLSSIDRATGGRLGTAKVQSKSALAGNRMAAIREQQEQQKAKEEVSEFSMEAQLSALKKEASSNEENSQNEDN